MVRHERDTEGRMTLTDDLQRAKRYAYRFQNIPYDRADLIRAYLYGIKAGRRLERRQA